MYKCIFLYVIVITFLWYHNRSSNYIQNIKNRDKVNLREKKCKFIMYKTEQPTPYILINIEGYQTSKFPTSLRFCLLIHLIYPTTQAFAILKHDSCRHLKMSLCRFYFTWTNRSYNETQGRVLSLYVPHFWVTQRQRSCAFLSIQKVLFLKELHLMRNHLCCTNTFYWCWSAFEILLTENKCQYFFFNCSTLSSQLGTFWFPSK